MSRENRAMGFEFKGHVIAIAFNMHEWPNKLKRDVHC